MPYWTLFLLIQAFISFVFLSLTAFIAHYLDDALRSVPVQPYLNIHIRTPESILIENSENVIDELCSEKFGTCFQIRDELTQGDWSYTVFRALRRKGVQGNLLLSYARLLPPEYLTFENVDTKTWEVDKTWVHLYYARLMITGAFFSGALDYGSTATQKVLILGLGGGVINNFFSDVKPEKGKIHVTSVDIDLVMVKIAKKWYDLRESSRHKVVVDDAVHFIREAVVKEMKYEVILVDVCYNKVRQLMCPIDEFLNDTVIEDMSKIIKRHGAVIVNVVTNDDALSSFEHVKNIYSRHFPSCYLVAFVETDRILICSRKQDNSWTTNREKLTNTLIEVDLEFNFNIAHIAIPLTDSMVKKSLNASKK